MNRIGNNNILKIVVRKVKDQQGLNCLEIIMKSLKSKEQF